MNTGLFKICLVTAVAFIVTLFLLQPILFSDDQKTETKSSMSSMHEHCNQANTVLDQINSKIEQAHKKMMQLAFMKH